MLSEDLGQGLGEAQRGKVVASCDHLGLSSHGQPKPEVHREPGSIPSHLLVEPLGRHSIEVGQVSVNDDSFTANEENSLLHRASRSEGPGCRHRLQSLLIKRWTARAQGARDKPAGGLSADPAGGRYAQLLHLR